MGTKLTPTVGGQNFASKPEARAERERHDSPVSARGQPLLPNNCHDWMAARGYLHLAKFCPIGIYLKNVQTAPNSRFWMLRLIREVWSDLQSFCPIDINLTDSQFAISVDAREHVRPAAQIGMSRISDNFACKILSTNGSSGSRRTRPRTWR